MHDKLHEAHAIISEIHDRILIWKIRKAIRKGRISIYEINT